MGFANFKPDVWSSKILEERDRFCVGVNLCDRSCESDIVDFGKSIKLNFTTRPTVKSYIAGSDIDSAEVLAGSSATLNINQQRYVHFIVDDVDELQSKPELMSSCMKEAAAAIAEDADDFIYDFYAGVPAANTITNTAVTSANILSIVSDAAKKLYENNVPTNEEIYLEVSPAIYQKLWLAKIIRSTNNENDIENGFVGYVDNFKVFMTNGIKVTDNVHHCFARTKKAVAFAGQMKKTEAYRPDKQFADAVKSLHVYGAIVQRPKELIRLDLTPAAE